MARILYSGLADILAVAHGLLICCVVAGTAATVAGRLRKAALVRTYYLLLLAVILSQVVYGECVLTGWEKILRNLAEPQSAYSGSFIGHYFPFIDPDVSWIGPVVIAVGLLAIPAWWAIGRWKLRKVTRSK